MQPILPQAILVDIFSYLKEKEERKSLFAVNKAWRSAALEFERIELQKKATDDFKDSLQYFQKHDCEHLYQELVNVKFYTEEIKSVKELIIQSNSNVNRCIEALKKIGKEKLANDKEEDRVCNGIYTLLCIESTSNEKDRREKIAYLLDNDYFYLAVQAIFSLTVREVKEKCFIILMNHFHQKSPEWDKLTYLRLYFEEENEVKWRIDFMATLEATLEREVDDLIAEYGTIGALQTIFKLKLINEKELVEKILWKIPYKEFDAVVDYLFRFVQNDDYRSTLIFRISTEGEILTAAELTNHLCPEMRIRRFEQIFDLIKNRGDFELIFEYLDRIHAKEDRMDVYFYLAKKLVIQGSYLLAVDYAKKLQSEFKQFKFCEYLINILFLRGRLSHAEGLIDHLESSKLNKDSRVMIDLRKEFKEDYERKLRLIISNKEINYHADKSKRIR